MMIYNVNHETIRDIDMAANALVTTRIDPLIKAEASAVLLAMGLTVSDAVRLMLTKVAKEHALPFDPLVPNQETINAMLEARRGGLKSFDSIETLIADLHA
jgi:DNA-damage-inducible protein J